MYIKIAIPSFQSVPKNKHFDKLDRTALMKNFFYLNTQILCNFTSQIPFFFSLSLFFTIVGPVGNMASGFGSDNHYIHKK